MQVVYPGTVVPIDSIEETLKIGPGLTHATNELIANKAGLLHIDSNKYYVESSQKRVLCLLFDYEYVPVTGESVIGIVKNKSAENYRVDIGSAHNASLSVLAFEGATKRNRPMLQV
jgi:exosome complex component RRP40